VGAVRAAQNHGSSSGAFAPKEDTMRFIIVIVVVLITVPCIVATLSWWPTGSRGDLPPDFASALAILRAEEGRSEKLEHCRAHVDLRYSATDHIVKQLISGDMSLDEAISRICCMRTQRELNFFLESRRGEYGSDNEEAVCRYTLSLVQQQLEGSGRDGQAVMARLEREQAAYLQSGEKIIPD
jgi:hypothetical protein